MVVWSGVDGGEILETQSGWDSRSTVGVGF